jgi:hypothetical protein
MVTKEREKKEIEEFEAHGYERSQYQIGDEKGSEAWRESSE